MTDFKTKMAELAAKYNISHKRDIDWHNFVAEVEELTHPELAESEDDNMMKDIVAAVEMYGDFTQSRKEEIYAYLEKQKEQKPVSISCGHENDAEWSEEDEKQIRQIERIVKDAGCTLKLQEQIHNWLKSLRPQSHYTKRNELFDHCVANCAPEVMKEVSDNVDKLKAISTPAEEDWFKVAEEWEKEDNK